MMNGTCSSVNEVISIKVGVLSDTHIPGRGKHIPKALREGFEGVDLIIHCGDIAAGYVSRKKLKKHVLYSKNLP